MKRLLYLPVLFVLTASLQGCGRIIQPSVSAGVGHSCGVTTEGAAYCWGSNQGGLLGDGTNTVSIVPVPVVTPWQSQQQ